MRAVLVGLVVAALAISCAGSEGKPDALGAEGGAAPVEVKKPAAPVKVDWRTRLKASTWTRLPLAKTERGIYPVTSIAASGKDLAVATFGRGLFVSRTEGKEWRQFDAPKRPKTSKNEDPGAPDPSMKTDYLSGVDLFGDDLWVRSVGHGFGVQKMKKRTWRWWSSRQLEKEFLFPTALASLGGGGLTIATTDGLWRTGNSGDQFMKITPAQGLPSEYVLAYAQVGGDGAEQLRGEWIGVLGGLHHVALSGARRQWTVKDGLPSNRIRGIHVAGSRLLVRTDAGLGISADGGASWKAVGELQGLASGHIYGVAVAGDVAFVGTGRGLAAVSLPDGEVKAVYLEGADPRRNQVTAVQIDGLGRLLAGTGEGLYVVEVGEAAAQAPDFGAVCQPGSALKERQHPVWPRPISEAANPLIDQTYQFGQTWGGQFGVHKGVEFNNAEGTEVLAVARGEVTFAAVRGRDMKVVTVRHDEPLAGKVIYSLYIHLSEIRAKVGDKVEAGAVLGLVGHTGAATNDHLHLEVRFSEGPGDGMEGATAINPTPFIAPLPGRGAVAGTVRQKGKRLDGARVYGPIVPEPQDTPFGFYEVYGKGSAADPVLGEDFYIADVPEGVYPVEVFYRTERREACVKVEAGKIAWIDVAF